MRGRRAAKASFLRALATASVRRKLLITAGLLALYRVGSVLPAPDVSVRNVHLCVDSSSQNGILALIGMFSGGALTQLSLLSLGAMPYVTASIMLQLLVPVVPRLKALKLDGATGQAKITQYTRYTTVALAAAQATGLILAARGAPSGLFSSCRLPILSGETTLDLLSLGTALLAGAVVVMWLGEQITERGIGNGISLILLTSIAARLPSQGQALAVAHGWPMLLAAIGVLGLLVIGVVVVEQATRRIPLVYARRRVHGPRAKALSHLPLKVNQSGVVPVIFASSLLYAPVLAVPLTGRDSGFARFVSRYISSGHHPVYLLSFVVLIVFFAFFYVSTTFDPAEVSDDLRKAGGFVPGVAPGEPTAALLDQVTTRLTAAGAVYLAVLALLPLALVALAGGGAALPLGGMGLLILVGVCLETVKQTEAQVQVRRTKGFLS